MIGPFRTRWSARLLLIGSAGALALIATAPLAPPAQARAWVSVGVPFPGYYYPGPYYDYPAPYSYYPYAPAYPPAAYYPAPAYPAPSAYAPPAGAPPASTYAPPAGTPGPSAYMTPPAAAPAPSMAGRITYTSKPAFTNAAGQTCREYTITAAGGQIVHGTACREADGQWRVAN
jgi:hypothetical protein